MLTDTAFPSDEALNAINAIDPDEVLIVGGAAAVSPIAEQVLADYGHASRRLAGDGRVATAQQVQAERTARRDGGQDAATAWWSTRAPPTHAIKSLNPPADAVAGQQAEHPCFQHPPIGQTLANSP